MDCVISKDFNIDETQDINMKSYEPIQFKVIVRSISIYTSISLQNKPYKNPLIL